MSTLAQAMICFLTAPIHQMKGFRGIHLKAVIQQGHINSIRNMSWEITLQFTPRFNELHLLVMKVTFDAVHSVEESGSRD